MPTATLEERVTNLERRMSDLEGQVGFLLPLVRQIHLDLLGFKEQTDERLERLDGKLDALDAKVEAMDATFTRKFAEHEVRFDRLEAKMDAKFERLEEAMPRAVAETVVELLKKQQR